MLLARRRTCDRGLSCRSSRISFVWTVRLCLRAASLRLRQRAGGSYLPLDTVEEIAVGAAKGPHAIAFELGSDGGEVDAGFLCAAQGLLGGVRVAALRTAHMAVVGERAQGHLGHRVYDVGIDQLLHVAHVGV